MFKILCQALTCLHIDSPSWLCLNGHMDSQEKKRVLFVCIFNSVRSQMAEGLLRDLAGEKFEVFSAGVHASRVNPLAIEAMEEIGIDISHQQSKTLDHFLNEPFDYVITVCELNSETCPTFRGAKQTLHWNIPDPNHAVGDHKEAFREIRDVLSQKIGEELLTSAH
jgi:arsenate reductase